MKPIRKYATRLIRNSLLTIGVLALIAFVVWWQNSTLRDSSFTTGYILIGSILFLTAYGWRKKLSFLPKIGSSRLWMQAHIYVGLGTFLIFGLHIGFRIPHGVLESFLAAIYLTVAFSGVYGLYLTKTVPRKLTNLHDEYIYEQIPLHRQRLALQVHTIIENAIKRSETLGRFYVNRLAPYFEKPRPVLYLIRPSTRESRQLQKEISQLDRYLAADQRDLGKELIQLVHRKDNLDYHRAMQGRLKYWLFLHVALTYSLLIVSVVHGVMAHAFHGGMR